MERICATLISCQSVIVVKNSVNNRLNLHNRMHWNVYLLIITLKVRHSENLYIHKNKTIPSSRLGKDGARRRGGEGERRRGGWGERSMGG